ncbi:predicted protein [Uncinocarpus reesii 1704]|uniref:Protein kinase domain-containing protein n=1 Tax=Uncinocarpus reesii (strain UAMH 1704) TaxID=336963 RepID=C4JJ90_UNCRE|nr:uncharacterized protein UREG_01697 [Uncinocarpus reesii 1704]EEP76848.1 predicted protein [Uncinocarpus reesii 1704]
MALLSPDQVSALTAADVSFNQVLKEGEFSTVFQVLIRDQKYVMKVLVLGWTPPNRETNIFICESTAYRRLKAKRLYEKGLVPDFYGEMENLDPDLWRPHLDSFLRDELRPCAVVLEYIPKLQKMQLSNFSEARAAEFRAIFLEIQQAHVYHGDPYPRNMMVSYASKPERCLWIDFDRAQTYSEGELTPRQKELMGEEIALVDNFFEDAVR